MLGWVQLKAQNIPPAEGVAAAGHPKRSSRCFLSLMPASKGCGDVGEPAVTKWGCWGCEGREPTWLGGGLGGHRGKRQVGIVGLEHPQLGKAQPCASWAARERGVPLPELRGALRLLLERGYLGTFPCIGCRSCLSSIGRARLGLMVGSRGSATCVVFVPYCAHKAAPSRVLSPCSRCSTWPLRLINCLIKDQSTDGVFPHGDSLK